MNKIVLASICFLYSVGANAQKHLAPVISGGEFWKVILGLFFVIVCILVLSIFVRKINGIGLTNHHFFKVISGVSLGTKERLLLVKAGQDYFLIGVSQGRVSKIHDYGPDIQLPEVEKMSFSKILQEKLKKST
jgi:flagellar protein FliO/FliZ